MGTGNAVNGWRNLTGSGNPNGAVAGNISDQYFDETGFNLWQCSVTGSSATAVWVQMNGGSAVASNAQIQVNAASTTLIAGTYNNGSSGIGATYTITATGVITLDGVTVVLNGVYLLKDFGGTNNGVYLCSTAGAVGVSAVFTRAINYNTSALIASNIQILALSGSTLSGVTFTLSSNTFPIIVGSTSISYVKPAEVGLNSSTLNLLVGTAGNLLNTVATVPNAFVTTDSGGFPLVTATPPALNQQIQVNAATTVNIVGTYNNGTGGVGATFTVTATGVQTFDGQTVVLAGVYLFKNQTTSLQNGIYTCTTAGAVGVQAVFTRATNFNTTALIQSNIQIYILAGTVNEQTTYFTTSSGTFVIGTTGIAFQRQVLLATPVTSSSLLLGPSSQGQANLSSLNGVSNGVPSFNGSTWVVSTTLPSGLTIPQPSITGVISASNAAAGAVGEFVSSVIALASAVTLTNGAVSNITSISLTAGDWDISGNFAVNTTGLSSLAFGWTSITSVTQPDNSLVSGMAMPAITGPDYLFSTPPLRVNVSATTTVFLSCLCSFTTGTANACGGIYARRRR